MYDHYDKHNAYVVRYVEYKKYWNSKYLTKEYILEIQFFDDFGEAGVNGYLSEEFKNDMNIFCNRLKKFGFRRASIDWGGGSVYQIVIKKIKTAMKYLKLFEYYNNYYFEIYQEEFDRLIEARDIFCFTELDMASISNFLTKFEMEYEFTEAYISITGNDPNLPDYYEEEEISTFFFIYDTDSDLDKNFQYNSVNVHLDSENVQKINKEDAFNKKIIIKNFSLIIFERIKVPRRHHFEDKINKVYVNKVSDEWFLVCHNNGLLYKCDQIEGLLEFLLHNL